VPVGSFELTLPQGKFSALAANGDLCKATLVMPTSFVAQNGRTISQGTPIQVSGCSRTLSIASHSIKGRSLELSLIVPSAGKVMASGPGLSGASKNVATRSVLKLVLHRTKGGRISTTVRLRFVPSKGKSQSKKLTVSFGP